MPFVYVAGDAHGISPGENSSDSTGTLSLVGGGAVVMIASDVDDYARYSRVAYVVLDSNGTAVSSWDEIYGRHSGAYIVSAALPDGSFVFAYQASGGTAARHVAADGTLIAEQAFAAQPVAGGATLSLSTVRATAGGYDIYYESSTHVSYVQHYDADDAQVGTLTPADPPAAPETRLYLSDGSYLTSVSTTLLEHHAADGTVIGDPIAYPHHGIAAFDTGHFIAVNSQDSAYSVFGFVDDGAWSATGHYWGSEGGDALELAGGSVTVLGQGGDDTLSVGAAGNTQAIFDGGDGDDHLAATLDNGDFARLAGGAGNDHLELFGALSSSSSLDGGAGDDRLELNGTVPGTYPQYSGPAANGGDGDDVIVAHLNISDVVTKLNGQGGTDSFDISGGTFSINGGDGDDLVRISAPVEGLVFTGGAGADSFSMAEGSVGAAATFLGFQAGPGGDVLDLGEIASEYGWNGTDNPFADGTLRLVQHGGQTEVQVNTAPEGADPNYWTLVAFTGNASALTADNFEDGWTPTAAVFEAQATVSGTDAPETVTGTSLDELLYGLGGDDTINGMGGADSFFGGEGNDTLVAGSDSNYFDGGNGFDIVDYSHNVGQMQLDIAAGTGTGDASAGVYVGIEGYRLSNYADTFYGSAADEFIDGAGGNDTMAGRGGNDTYVVNSIGDVVIENAGEGRDSVNSSVSYTLTDNVENLLLTGTAAINGTGNGLDNAIDGNGQNNILNGGVGADTMRGGLGNDTYYVDNAGDKVVENADAGTDLVYSSVSFSAAGQYIENVTLTGTANINATGNSLANVIRDNAGVNVLAGGASNDTYYVSTVGDKVIEADGAGYDRVFSSVSFSLAGQYAEDLTLTGSAVIGATGNALDNVLTGNNAANRLDGGAGADRMIGGLGDDTYYIDNAGDVIVEANGEGTDSVFSSVGFSLNGQYLENLTLTGTAAINGTGNGLANVLTGNGAANTLTGGAGNDTLDGGAGADRMVGGAGDDLYYVDNAGDTIIELEGQGADSLFASVSYSIAGLYIENFTLTGAGNINATGNSLANTITGNAGSNRIDGGAGADMMAGGAGNDTYVVDNSGDRVTELAGQGTDTVLSSISFNLGSQYIENVTLTGTAAINSTGNGLDNVMRGNDGANKLDGSAGNDQLHGGLGLDTLTGGAGQDGFWFDTALSAANVDVIADFTHADDTIYLDHAVFASLHYSGALLSGNFVAGAAAHDANDYILYDAATGNLYYDADGSGAGAAVRFAHVAAGTAIDLSDFAVV